ncbi:MAG: methyltransferase [Alphaproteobacteria bacterium]|nr:methyltransferase [Alphaproteobacteria bacterium]
MLSKKLKIYQQPSSLFEALEFDEIKKHFDKLNADESHFINSNDICTPMACVKEMVDSIPESFWGKKNLKILDSCCGNGNFHAYIRTKTKLENLYFNEINEKRIANLENYFGDNLNITIQDFLTFKEDEKYDLVVSNPPYAKFNENGRTSKNHNLSRDFIKKALSITKNGGYILFIVPNNWMSFSDRNILPTELTKYQFIHIDIHGAKKWFPKVGSSFTWFLLHKVPNKKSFSVANNYVMKDEQIVKLDSKQKFLPLYVSQTVMDILKKTINNNKLPKYKIETTSDLHRTTKKMFLQEKQDSEYKYKIIHTPTQIVWSKKKHKYQEGWKVFISLTNQYSTFIDNCGMTQSIAFIRCSSKEEALKIKAELDNHIYIFLNNITRYGNFNNIRILQQFPILENVNLDSQEIEFISNFNQEYYGKTKK